MLSLDVKKKLFSKNEISFQLTPAFPQMFITCYHASHWKGGGPVVTSGGLEIVKSAKTDDCVMLFMI